jgi:sec-independent protein translocase protein TatA
MGRLFDGPWPILVIIVVALLLFAAPKLPTMARSLGQSVRILRTEVKEMKNEDSETLTGSEHTSTGAAGN